MSRCGPVTSGPISDRSSRAGADAQLGDAVLDLASTSSSPTGSTATTTEIAMQRSPAEPYPASTARVGGQVEVGVGQHDHVVLRAAQGLHALAAGVPVS